MKTQRLAPIVSGILCISLHAQPANAPLRIGLDLPLSGASADFGRSARFGAELAVREINEVGGYLGRPLELVLRDDRADPVEGRRIAQEFVGLEGVAFTIGYCNSGVALNAIDVYQKARQLLIVPCATGTEITHRYLAAQSYIFRLAPTDAMMVRFLGREIVERRRLRRIAVLADSTGYGAGGLQDMRAELARHGIEPVYVARFPLGVSSLTDSLRQARRAGAQALVVFAVGPEQAVATESRAELQWDVPYFAPWPLSFRSAIDRAGAKALEGTMMVQTIIHDLANERRLAFLASYYSDSKDKPIGSLMAAAQTYDAVNLMIRALFASNGDSAGPALKAALEGLHIDYRGVVTTYEHPFNTRDHDAFSGNMLWLGVWREGEIRYYYQQDATLSSVVRDKAEPR